MDFRRRRAGVILLAFAVTVLVYTNVLNPSLIPLLPYNVSIVPSSDRILQLQSFVESANATLGFGAIAAVSRSASPRRKGLLTAAYITDLDISLPDQPTWTDDDLAALRHPTESTISRGSALAWLGHLNVLRYFLDSDLDTMLILEDDVDWDVHLRSFQIPYIAALVRTLISPERHHDPSNKPANDNPRKQNFVSSTSAGGYWGHTDDWDIIYLGHCGDRSPPSFWSNESAAPPPHATFSDPTLPVLHDLDTSTEHFLSDLKIPSQTRLVHRSVSPLCTFGYAVTREAAERILYDEAAREHDGGCVAYDVLILELCRDQGFRCWTVNPEVFHHQRSASMIEAVDGARDIDQSEVVSEGTEYQDGVDVMSEDDAPPADHSIDTRLSTDEEHKHRQGGAQHQEEVLRDVPATPNIQCGVRDSAFFSENRQTLDYFRNLIRGGVQCSRSP